MKREHWKRIPLSNDFVHVLVRHIDGERWCAKLLPGGLCRIWRGTRLVHERETHTKASARIRMEELIAETRL